MGDTTEITSILSKILCYSTRLTKISYENNLKVIRNKRNIVSKPYTPILQFVLHIIDITEHKLKVLTAYFIFYVSAEYNQQRYKLTGQTIVK